MWSMTEKKREPSPLVCKKCCASERCPLLEIGKNSVIPCTMPRMIALRTVI